MRVKYFFLGMFLVFLSAAGLFGFLTVYQNSSGVISQDGGIAVFSETGGSYIITFGEKDYAFSLENQETNPITQIVTPNIIKADIGFYAVIKDIYVDFLKNLEEKT